MCVSQCECVCVRERERVCVCVRESECVCVRGSTVDSLYNCGTNGVEERGRGSRDGECVSELESEYERVRTRELI